MQRKTYVIVGGSAAGMAAAEAIARHDPDGRVRVLSEEVDAPYFRPLIPFIISRKKEARQIFLQGQGPYRNENTDIRLETRAHRIDTRARTVATATGETISYDRLLVATGSRPYIPEEIGGTGLPGVFALRTLADARAAERRAATTRHAVMLGGGLLNLKAAFALLERGIAVTLVVFSPEVLSPLMEPDDALLIRRALDRAGLRIVTGTAAVAIEGNANGVSGVVLTNGEEMACEMVCIGKGVRPNTQWIDDTRIDVRTGVVVDKFTRTSAPGVYAAGDVAVTFDPISGDPMVTGLWTNAVEMGRCAGANMAGRDTAYGGTFGILNATQVARVPFVSMGVVHTAGTDYEIHTRLTSDAYRKLVFSPDGHRLIGAVFVGDIDKAGLYRVVIRDRMQLNGIKRQVINHRLHYGHLMLAGKSG
jgi:NAD(P)H-nitrite reductase large subunit